MYVPQKCPFPWEGGGSGSVLMHGSMGLRESATRTAVLLGLTKQLVGGVAQW